MYKKLYPDRLVERFETVREYFQTEPIRGFENFPKECTLSCVVGVWKFAVKYREKQILDSAIENRYL